MFDGLGSMMKLLGNKDKIAAEAAKLRETMATIVGEGSAGGLVTVRASGTMEILSVSFSDAGAGIADRKLLEDVVAAATNQALQSARQQVAAETQKMAASLGLPPGMLANIPGLG